MDIKKTLETAYWIRLAQGSGKRWSRVNTALKVMTSQKEVSQFNLVHTLYA
jgi:hypothetical protein